MTDKNEKSNSKGEAGSCSFPPFPNAGKDGAPYACYGAKGAVSDFLFHVAPVVAEG